MAISTENSIILSWKPPISDGGSEIKGYRVYRGTSSGTYLPLGVVTDTSFIDHNVEIRKTYYYVVAAYNNVKEGELSNEVNATPSEKTTTSNSIETTISTTTETSTSVPQLSSFPSLFAVLIGILVVVKRNRQRI